MLTNVRLDVLISIYGLHKTFMSFRTNNFISWFIFLVYACKYFFSNALS